MRVRPRFSIDSCSQKSRLLLVFKSLCAEDLTHVIIYHAYSAGLHLSPPLFFGLRYENSSEFAAALQFSKLRRGSDRA